jgi:hypothetical protein
MATKYTPAPDVRKIAEDLIPKYHPHLTNVRIEYAFGDKTPKHGGKEVWGYVRKISSLPAYLASQPGDQKAGDTTPFFVMVISEDVWVNLYPDKRTALVDHELCHCGVEVDDEGNHKLILIPHDMEEFSSIVRRYGLWREDVRDFVNTAKSVDNDSNEDFEDEVDVP